jgi:hypothetical protein
MMTPASSRFGLELIEQHPSARNHARHDRTLHHHVEAALHRAGRERRAGAKIMPAVRKALEKARRIFRLSNLDREGLPA